MPAFVIPAFQQIVTGASDAAVKAFLSGGGVLANAANLSSLFPNVIDGAAAIAAAAAQAGNAAAALLTSGGTQALTAGARVALASASAGGGNFIGLLGGATNSAAGTVDVGYINDLIRQGYTVTRFNICVCPNCIGALKGVGAHINVTGFNVTPPVGTPTITTVDPLSKGFEQAATELKGIKLNVPAKVPEPPVNVGLIIAIVLALKNQIEAGARTFSDIVTTTLIRGNAGGASPFHNLVQQLEGQPVMSNMRTIYPILDENGSFVPPIANMLRPEGTEISTLPQIPNREHFPNGQSLFIQERIKNVEQVVQGYFEITQYYHFCYAANVFANQQAPTYIQHRDTLQNMLNMSDFTKSHPLFLDFRQHNIQIVEPEFYIPGLSEPTIRPGIAAEEVLPITNTLGYWEANARGFNASDLVGYGCLIQYFNQDTRELELSSDELALPFTPELIRKYGFVNDGVPTEPPNVIGWNFVPTGATEYDHIIVFDEGYRIRMRPSVTTDMRMRYIGRTVRDKLWREKSTVLKDAVAITGAALSPLTGGISSIISTLLNFIVPEIEFPQYLPTTIDTFAVQWYVPYALHYGAWTQPGLFKMSPQLDAPISSFSGNATLDINTTELMAGFDGVQLQQNAPYAYKAGTKFGASQGNSGFELSYGYPSVYNLTVAPLELAVLSTSALSFNQFTASWTAILGAQDYIIDVATTEDFSTLVVDARVVNGLSTVIIGLTPNTTYYARVRGREDGFVSLSSNVVTLTTPNQPRPNALPATNVSFDTLTANWTTVSGAADYLLDVSLVANFATTILNGQVVVGTSFPVPNLTPNTTYYYRVRSRANGSTSAFSNIITTTTDILNLDAPVATSPTTVLTDQFTANWQPVTNALDYLLDVSTAADFSAPVLTGQVVNGTNFPVTLLTANTRYYYRVRARNGAVISPYSNVITLLTSNVVVPPVASLDAPVATAATSLTHQSFNANWQPVVNANDYLLDVATDAGFSSLIVAGQVVNGTLSAVTGLTPLTPYWYRVRARNGAVLSPYSNVINPTTLDTPLPAPTANPAGGTVNFTATWSTVPSADDYLLDVSLSPSFSSFVVQAQTVVGTSQFVGGLTAGATYFYRVRARRGGTFSPNSNIVTVQLGLATPVDPVATAATAITSNSFTANWNNVAGASDYLLDVATDVGFGSLIVNNRVVAALSSDVVGLSPNVQYWYRVRARNATGTSNNSNVITLQTPLLPQPGAPNILPCTNITATGFQANWTLVPGAIAYSVQISTDNNFSIILQSQGLGVQNNFTFAGLATNTTYYVRVNCNNPLANPSQSAFSGTAQVRLGVPITGTFPQPPTSGFPFAAPDQITVNGFRLHWIAQQDWDFSNVPVPGTPVGQTYELDVARDIGFTDFFVNSQAVSSLTAILSNVQNNPAFYYGIFYYRLRARSQDGTLVSVNSATYSVQMPVPNPDVVTPFLTSENITTTSIEVRLNNRDPRIFRGNVDSPLGDYYRLEVSLSPSFAQVHVLNIVSGNAVQAAGMTSPGNSGADASYFSFPTLVVQGLQPATQYYFRFRALFNFPYTPYGASITATTLGVPNNPPTVLTATNIGQCRFQANWLTNNVASYDVEVQKHPSGDFVRLDNLAALLLLVNEPQVQPTNFAYRVRSVSAQGARSPYSALQPVVMQPFFDPVAMTPSLITTTSFRVNWTAQVNAVQYRVVVRQAGTMIIDTIAVATQFDTQSVMVLAPDTVYTVQIFPRNTYGEEYQNPNLAPIIQVVQTLGAMSVIPPNAPALAFVSSTTTSITLNLTGTVANTDYTLDVALDAAFTSLVASGLYAEAGNNIVAALQPDTLYYARARGYNGAYSPYSANTSGRTQLGAPTLLVGEEITTTGFRLRWTAPQTVVQTHVDVARDAAFTDFVLNDFVVVGLLTTVVAGLESETTYWARVRTENPRGTTQNSNVREITTDSEDDEVNVAVF